MEVTPEVYAWLAEHKILNAEKTLLIRKDNTVIIDDSVTKSLINGYFMDKILYELENLYNKFYKIKLIYTQKLEEIKIHQQNIKNSKMDKTVRNTIWKIIGQIIENFGIEVSEEKINLLSNGDNDTLKNLLKSIFTLANELKKRSNPDKSTDLNKYDSKKSSLVRNKSPENNFSPNSKIKNPDLKSPNKNNNFSYNQNSSLLKSKKINNNSLNNSSLINESNDNGKILNRDLNNIKESSLGQKSSNTNVNSKTTNKNDGNDIIKGKLVLKKNSESLDLNNLNGNKNLDEAESPLEFFILTLSRSLDMKPRQAVALLSNNRKFLIQITNRGIKGDFNKITNWYQEVIYNYSILINILKFSSMKDIKAMTYATLSVGLFSKNLQVAQNSYGILIQLEADIGSDFDWLIKDGLESFVFCINKHEDLRIGLLNLVYKMGSRDIESLNNEFFNTKKFTNSKIYEFVSNILETLRFIPSQFFNFFKNSIPEFCIKENTEKTTAISVLTQTWLIIGLSSDVDGVIINNIIKFFKNCMREKDQKILQVVVINQFFRLLAKLCENKDSNVLTIYKILVFHFLENYDEKYLREVYINNFTFFFCGKDSEKKEISLDILMEPYLRQIKNSSNFDIIDFSFLIILLDNPKITIKILNEILEFAFYVSLTNMFYSRSANNLISKIIEKHLIEINNKLVNNEKINNKSSNYKLFDDIIKYIKNALKVFIQSPKDYMILENSYDILNFDFDYVKKNVENDIVETVEIYRREKGVYSMGLLALLWYYESHDDILLNLEEKYTEKIDKYYVQMEKKRRLEQEEKENKKYIKSKTKNFKPTDIIKMIKERREKEIKLQEEIKIKRELHEKRLIKNLSKKVLDKSQDAAKSVIETNINNYTQLNSNLTDLTAIENNISSLNNNLSALVNNINIFNPYGDISALNNSKNYNNSYNNIILRRSGSAGNISKVFNSGNALKKNPLSFYKNFPYFINLEELETREIVAIEGLFRQYKNLMNKILYNYSTDGNNNITRVALLKLIREIGIENDIICLDELSYLIRLTFGIPLNNIDKEKFYRLIIQVSNLIFSKIKPYVSISKSLEEFLFLIDKLLNKNNSEIEIYRETGSTELTDGLIKNPNFLKGNRINNYNKIGNKVLNYLQSRIENVFLSDEEMVYVFNPSDLIVTNAENFKEDSESVSSYNNHKIKKNYESESIYINNRQPLMPPGFKKKLTTKVEFDYNLNKDLCLSFLPECYIISYEIINEIIKNTFKKSIIEPYVKVYNYFKVIEEPVDPKKKWGDEVAICFSKMEKKNEILGKEVGFLVEDILRAIDKGWNSLEKPKILPPKEKENLENQMKIAKENEEKDKRRIERKKEIKGKLEKLKEEKKNDFKIKEEEIKKIKDDKQREFQLHIQKEKEIKEKLRRDIIKAKQTKDKEKEEKMKFDMQKAEEAKKKKDEEKLDFFKKQKRKLKEQFKEIKNEKNIFLKQQQELLNIKLPEVNIKKILDKDKDFVGFEKNLNESIAKFISREDIKEFLSNYEGHFRTIHDIYSKIGSNKITFFYEDAIHFNEFREFCVNFMILGLLINTDQMTYIFRKVSKRNEGKSDDNFFLKYPDFLICIIYICLYLKITNRAKGRILPGDLEKLDISTIKSLVDFIGLKLPFDKIELEDFINDRRALSAKQILKLQTQFKRERTDIVKPTSANRVRSSLLTNIRSLKKDKKINRDKLSFNKEIDIDNTEDIFNTNNSSTNIKNVKTTQNAKKNNQENDDDRWQVVKKKK